MNTFAFFCAALGIDSAIAVARGLTSEVNFGITGSQINIRQYAARRIFWKAIENSGEKVYNTFTTEQTGACKQAERKV